MLGVSLNARPMTPISATSVHTHCVPAPNAGGMSGPSAPVPKASYSRSRSLSSTVAATMGSAAGNRARLGGRSSKCGRYPE